MGMSVGQESGDEEDKVVSEINTTPLVDVMLVLLIIFLITIPVVTTSVKVNLPKENSQVRETKPENVILSVDTKNQIYWYDTKINTIDELKDRLEKSMKGKALEDQPAVQIRGDARANYEGIGRALYACLGAGVAKVGFLSEPAARQ
jgi:biopolymer transport protein ExbD